MLDVRDLVPILYLKSLVYLGYTVILIILVLRCMMFNG